ncbi:MAG: hypothetical protein JXC31_04410 [Acholeplasmataceae bacterium]|nr:hypothetical protein [Acholeplasmataceae bacterium]
MITIVTGKINEGKTTTLKAHYHEHKKGDGFISEKKMADQKVHSYTSIRLSTQEHKLLMLHEYYYSESFASAGKIGPYFINLFTLDWIEKSISKMIEERIEPIYLDEIGILEIKGYGYDRILRKMIDSKLDLIISAREDLFQSIIQTYELKDVKYLKVKR